MIDQILHLWNDEGCSMSEIAGRMGKTKGQISGLINRAKSQGVVFKSHRKATEAPVRAERLIKVRPPRIPVSFENEIPRLKYNECRFIINADMSSPIYCKAPISRVSYCEGHAALCFTPARKSYK